MSFDREIFEPEDDLLGRKDLANNLYSYISTTTNQKAFSSFVIGISGQWGTGKSSLLNLYKKKIEQDSSDTWQDIIFNFSPWIYSSEENLYKEYYKSLLELISPKPKGMVHRGKKFLSKYAWVANAFPDYKGLVDSLIDAPSDQKKTELGELIAKDKIRLHVFIDDLDRIEPKQLIQILQLVKRNADLSNTIYYLSYDPEIVESHIDKYFEGKGKEFLEKIVQIEFRLPFIAEEKLWTIFQTTLDRIFKEHEIRLDSSKLRYDWLVAYQYCFLTVREIKRFELSLTLSLLSIKNEVNIRSLIAIEVLKLVDYKAVTELFVNYDSFRKNIVGTDKNFRIPSVEDLQLSVIKLAFYEGRNGVRISNSFSNPEHYTKYFTFTLDTKDFSWTYITEFITTDLNFKIRFLNDIHNSDKLIFFFKSFRNPQLLETVTKDQVQEVMEAILEFYNHRYDLLQEHYLEVCELFLLLIKYKEKPLVYFKTLILSETQFSYSKYELLRREVLGVENIGKAFRIEDKVYNDLKASLKLGLTKWSSCFLNTHHIGDRMLLDYVCCYAQLFPEEYIEFIIPFFKPEHIVGFSIWCSILTTQNGGVDTNITDLCVPDKYLETILNILKEKETEIVEKVGNKQSVLIHELERRLKILKNE